MAIKGMDQTIFESVLKEFIRPSEPISTFEHLFDREQQLMRIEEALNSPGRHVFIYGDRGAGKTSLAQTAAYKHHPSAGEPVFCACGRNTSFASIVRDIVFQLDNRSQLTSQDRTSSAGVQGMGLNLSVSQTAKQKGLETLDLNVATSAIREAADRRGGRSIVVVDEFEDLPTLEERQLFSELVKQLSDRRAPVSLIFCGIGKSMDDLLQGHNSAHRYIEEVKLPSPPLTFSGRWAIVDAACNALNLSINDDSRLRIAQVSDGFPHYVHLISQKLFWVAFRDDREIEELSSEHYMEAIKQALESVESRLRNSYDIATKKDQDFYEEVLWAVADHFELERNNRRVFSESYMRIVGSGAAGKLPFEGFQSRLSNLRSTRHGSILKSDRRGWVKFSENLIRGYVRLVAESHGVRLAERGPEAPVLSSAARGRGLDPAYPSAQGTPRKKK